MALYFLGSSLIFAVVIAWSAGRRTGQREAAAYGRLLLHREREACGKTKSPELDACEKQVQRLIAANDQLTESHMHRRYGPPLWVGRDWPGLAR